MSHAWHIFHVLISTYQISVLFSKMLAQHVHTSTAPPPTPPPLWQNGA